MTEPSMTMAETVDMAAIPSSSLPHETTHNSATSIKTWAEAVVGRDWEIFWNDQENDQEQVDVAESASIGNPPPAEETGKEEKQSSADDAQDTVVDKEMSAAEQPAEAPVNAEEERSLHKDATIPLTNSVEQEQTTTSPMETEETGETSAEVDDTNKEISESEEEATVHEDGWYLGRIEEYIGVDDEGTCIFRIRFVGDEETYEMPLQPEHVRPGNQRWIMRTLALLHAAADKNLCDNLPSDTSLPRDTEALSSIRQQIVNISLPDLSHNLQARESSEGAPVSSILFTLERMDTLRRLRCLVEEQIYLRSKLGPVDEDESDDSYAYEMDYEEKPPPPSEPYVNHLVESLKQVKHAIVWIEEAYLLLAQVFSEPTETPIRLTREKLIHVGLAKGQAHVQTLAQMNLFICPNRRKRKSPVKSATSDKPASRRLQNQNKRQRIEALYQESSAPASTLHGMLVPEMQPQDLWASTDVLIQYLRRILPDNPAWYLGAVADMLLFFDAQIVAQYREYEKEAEKCLGGNKETTDPPIEALSAVVGSSHDENMVEDKREGEEDNDRSFVSYHMILSTLERAEREPILSHLDFSNLVSKLRQRLLDIDDFEIRCWRVIGRVLEDVGSAEPESDPLLTSLRSQLQVANDPNSKVGNVHPLGRPSTDLTREVIEHAIVYRLWFLDLLCAESNRERVDFVESVVAQLTRLPPFQSPVVKSPSECAVDLSLTLDATAPRAQALPRRILDHVAIFNRYKTFLNDRQGMPGNHEWLEAKVDLTRALSDLGKASVLSVSEEMALCRKDVLQWLKETESCLSVERPSFQKVDKLFITMEALCRGHSQTRSLAVKDLRPNPQVDEEIRSFINADLEPFKEKYLAEIQRLYSLGSSWKIRYDAIIATLRYHGNPAVESTESATKNTSMIDLKRIEDLVSEYKSLAVELDNECKTLETVYMAATQWAATVEENLMKQEIVSYDDTLCFVEKANSDDVRPKGVIIHPTRQVLNNLAYLLRWHQQVRGWVGGGTFYPRPFHLMVEGAEIIEFFGLSKQGNGWHQAHANVTYELASEKLLSPKTKRSLTSLQKLQSSPLTESFLDRLFSQNEEKRLNFPLGHLLFFAWELEVGNILARVETSQKGTVVLDELRTLRNAMPAFDAELIEKVDGAPAESPRRKLIGLVGAYEKNEESILAACAKLKSSQLQRDCIRNPDEARSHYGALKELQAFLKGHPLDIDRELEARLDREIKLFSWMTRALDYHVLRTDDLPDEVEDTEDTESDPRIPWETLLKLYDTRPLLDEGDTGGLACLIVRIRELYEAASSWQDEISSFTQLSLRGGKRRESTRDETQTDDSEQVCVEKLTELCNHPILEKVAMPREAAVQSMLEYTAQFESLLYEFLGKDYGGAYPDRAPFPRGASLVEDGYFIPFRVVGSRLYEEAKMKLSDIDRVASNVFASTPGKKSFDWIKKAVEWIDSLNESFSKHSLGKWNLKMEDATNLLSTAEVVFLDVSDDLRQTLSQHGIVISANKEGKLTVKSKKKGAQYAIGTTIIRWCPILHDALKSDLSRSQRWSEKFRSLAQEYKEFQNTHGGGDVTDEAVMRCHMFQQEMSDLRHEVSLLVVAPSDAMVSYTSTFVNSLEDYLKAHSSPYLSKKAADLFFEDGKNVVRMRDSLRDALLDRLVSVRGALASSSRDEKHCLPFRYAARTVLKKALISNAERLDLQVSSAAMTALCEIKAFEIENALFQRFPGFGGEERISPEYRQQALALKRGLGDTGNIELCLQVLTGKMDPVAVANMPSEKLANLELRMERARAENAGKQASVLTKSATEMERKSKQQGKSEHLEASQADLALPSALKRRDEKDSSTSGATTQSVQLKRASKEVLQKVKPAAPPPPPPSLAKALRQPSQSESSTSWAINTDGSQQFYFSLANGSRNFLAGLVTEEHNDERIIPLSPELSEKGRLDVGAFSGFVKAKVSSGKWELRKYRIIGDTDSDETELGKFCKEYEAKKRLSMFSLEGGNKLFVIPPKFQTNIRNVMNFQMECMVYAVLLNRK